MLEFKTAVREVDTDEADAIDYDLDGALMTAYRPTGGQFAMLMAMSTQYSTNEESVAGLINMFINIHDEESQAILVKRLFDRNDGFDVEDVDRILRALLEDWSGRPTVQPSDSASSPPSTGRKSTARTPARTSSGSRRTAS